MLTHVSVAALVLTVAPLVLSLNRTVSTLSTLTNALTAVLAQVTALLVLPNSSNFRKTFCVFGQARFVRACYFFEKLKSFYFFQKGLFFTENMVYNIRYFGYNNGNLFSLDPERSLFFFL